MKAVNNNFEIAEGEPIGGGKLIQFVKIGNSIIDPVIFDSGEVASGIPVYELSDKGIIATRIDDLIHDYNMLCSDAEAGFIVLTDSERKDWEVAINFLKSFLL